MMYMKVPPPDDGFAYTEEEIIDIVRQHLYIERNVVAGMMMDIAERVDGFSADVLTKAAIAIASRNNMKDVYDHTVQ